ncbi:hypothetical protein HU200_002803 [Digitaria exilis]|uniref:PGG domain-containing protein n=1 Tax=Digitaria exilis TaxID=1010633 RepID=A0A835FYH8_9POAL|nr:hypothetical protein HU200_002803 [Digitaria exilis]
MLLAIFAATVTYTAGLSPPGGFWPDTRDGHRAGDPVLQDRHWHRFTAFFVCNSTAFVASLLVIALLLTNKPEKSFVKGVVLYACILLALLGLVVAYAAGSCRETDSTAYVTCLVGVVLAYTLLQELVWIKLQRRLQPHVHKIQNDQHGQSTTSTTGHKQASDEHGLKTARSLVLLLATLAATVTYQAGLNPPGGLWPDSREGHKGGDPVLLAKNAIRYRVFFYCNSTALAASLVVIFMVQNNYLSTSLIHQRHSLEAVMILDLISLIGAYAAGSCRDVTTSIFVVALAGAALVYVVFHMVFFTLDLQVQDLHKKDTQVENKRKQLLVVAILVATLTYQAGLTPPGGFWSGDNAELGYHAGDPVLFNNYPRRYMAFFYLNAASFMASVVLTILLVNPNLYRMGIRCHALSVCMVAGLFGLMGAYPAGSSRHLRTSIYMIALVAAVFVFIVILLLIIIFPKIITLLKKAETENNKGRGSDKIEPQTERRYLMLLGILAASVTYQAALSPPGGFWPDKRDGHDVGNPILRDSNIRRYHIFFYSNSTSFAASIVVMALLLLEQLQRTRSGYKDRPKLIRAMHTAIIIDLIGLLGAYAAGSSREWETCGYVFALVAVVLLYIAIHLSISLFHQEVMALRTNGIRTSVLALIFAMRLARRRRPNGEPLI